MARVLNLMDETFVILTCTCWEPHKGLCRANTCVPCYGCGFEFFLDKIFVSTLQELKNSDLRQNCGCTVEMAIYCGSESNFWHYKYL
jgi:hypothetical protein